MFIASVSSISRPSLLRKMQSKQQRSMQNRVMSFIVVWGGHTDSNFWPAPSEGALCLGVAGFGDLKPEVCFSQWFVWSWSYTVACRLQILRSRKPARPDKTLNTSLTDRQRMRCWKWPVMMIKSATVAAPYKAASVSSSKSTDVGVNPSIRPGWSQSAFISGDCQQLL